MFKNKYLCGLVIHSKQRVKNDKEVKWLGMYPFYMEYRVRTCFLEWGFTGQLLYKER